VAGRILKEDIDTLRQQADIVAVVGDYTTLKRAGRSFKGLCPFHTERTPSFTVTPDGNFYTCFGCGVSGDIYDFLMRIEGLEFPEAVEALARRSSYTLRYEQLSAREQRAVGERTRLVRAMAAAQEFYREQLYSDDGAVARDYLKERGFGREDAETFGLGFAPNRWEDLATALLAQGFPADDLVTVGLVTRTDRGRLRDRFRGRLLFPIMDAGGDVIGFGGRVLPALDYGDFDPPKYLNSAETPLYRKTRVLYGVPQARAEIVRQELTLICEGYTDVMALHQGGFANAVATCGTAVGTEHLRTIARYAPRVVFAFDGDAAGVKAAERAWEAAREVADSAGGAQLDLRVLALTEGRDPADLVRDVGADGLRRAVEAATPIVPFLVRHRLAEADLDTEAGRIAALRAAIEVLGRERDPDLRREWARTEVAAGVGVSYDHVVRTAARAGVDLDAHEGVAVVSRTASASGGSRGGQASDGGTGTSVDRRRARLEKDVLRAAFQHPELLPEEWYELGEDDLAHPTARTLFRCLTEAGGVGVPLDAVLAVAPDDEVRGRLRALALEDDPELDTHLHPQPGSTVAADPEVARTIVAGRVRRLVAVRVEHEESAVRGELAQLNHVTDRDRLLTLQRRLAELHQRRRELTRAE
jgi:DNA primase